MKLYGKTWTRREIEARVGRIDSLGGVRKIRLVDGPDDGVEFIQVRTGSGLTYYVNASRALDISLAAFKDVPLSWHSVSGEVHPGYFNPEGMEWLRTAAGGLLMTCGLKQAGAPSEDGGEKLGLHGRMHHTPAREVAVQSYWEGDDYKIQICGKVEETKIFAERLQLTRTIQSEIGVNAFQIEDVVENLGFESTPFMLLYHFNFGFPLMDEDSHIEIPSKNIIPREKELTLEGYDSWQKPEAGYQERVYYHEIDSKRINENVAFAEISNPNFPIGSTDKGIPLTVRLSWDVKALPILIEWKMPGAGTYAFGLEPANCLVEGRAAERERGTLEMLKPGEKKQFKLGFEILT